MFTRSSRTRGGASVHRIVLVALTSLAAAAALALAGPQDARAATVPIHTQPRLNDSSNSGWLVPGVDWWATYQLCAVNLSNPRVWGLTNDPYNEIVGWRPIAATYTTQGWKYIYGSMQFGRASYTWGQPPIWYANQDLAFTRGGTVWVPRGTYWIGFQLQDVTTSGYTWLFPSDGWLFTVTC
jgi:hypothetical protein